ncbi:COG2194 Predicted membrane-associated, metal-dependent hydrolase [Flavobacteriaceae bacterium]
MVKNFIELKKITPNYLILLICFSQFVLFCCNSATFNIRELVTALSWLPLLMSVFYILKKNSFYYFILILYTFETFCNVVHSIFLDDQITASSIFTLLNSNASEVFEFIESKFNYQFLFLIPYFLLVFLAFKIKPSYYLNSKFLFFSVFLSLLVSFSFHYRNYCNNWLLPKSIPSTYRAMVYFNREIKDFNEFKKRKVIKVNCKIIPQNSPNNVSVLVIGESASRNHMSLYGYSKITNPLLQIRDDIIVYKNVVSPYSSTIPSVLSMLTESNLENKKPIDKSCSVFDVFLSANYKTFWLSNQSPIGLYENAIYNLAQSSDYKLFVNQSSNNSIEAFYTVSYDDKILKPFKAALNDASKNKFIIVHLMGSHATYSKRYPKQFSKFYKAKNNKEQVVNEYDNSILYNDYILNSIFDILKTNAAKNLQTTYSCIYLSDHAENVYDQNNTFGHFLKVNLPKSVEIPFIVWLSNSYKSFYKEKSVLIQKNSILPYVSDDIFHTLLDLNFITCPQYQGSRSIFNESFNSHRKRILENNYDYDSNKQLPH